MELLDFLKKRGMLDRKRIAMCLESLSEPGNQGLFKECLDELAPEIIRMQLTCSPFDVPDDVAGKIVFATTETGMPVPWPIDMPHTAVFGSSNTGKTTCCMIMCMKALEQGYKAWIFARADDVTSLIRIFPDIFYDDFNGRMKINPLNFLSPEAFTSVFNDSFVLYEGSEAYMIEAIRELKRKNPEPNLYDLYFFIRARKHPGLSRTARYQESILNRLGGLINSSLGKTFDCVKGHENDIVKASVIFNVSGLTLSEQKFIVNSLLMHLYLNNKEHMKLVFVDDASMLLQESRELTLTDDIFSNIRKGSIHMIPCSQSPAELSPGILSNISNKLVFRLNSGRDIGAVHLSMGVTDKEQKAFFFRLKHEEREVILEFAGNARPFLAKIIHADFPEPMSKDEVYSHAENILEGFSKPVPRIREDIKEEKPLVSSNEKEFLMAVYLNQYRKTLTEIHDIAGFSACKGTKIAKRLEGAGMIKIIEIVKGKGVSKFPILLEQAYKMLNIEQKSFYGKGAGYEHLVWQNLIADHFKEHKPEIELNKFGKFIDVAVEHDGRLIAIEVAMSSANEKTNIEKDIGIARSDLVIIGCKDKKVKEEVMNVITGMPEEMRNKTTVLLLSEVLKSGVSELINRNTNQEE